MAGGLEAHRVQAHWRSFLLATSDGSPDHHGAHPKDKAASCRHWHGPGEHAGVCFRPVLEELTVPQGVEVRALLGEEEERVRG